MHHILHLGRGRAWGWGWTELVPSHFASVPSFAWKVGSLGAWGVGGDTEIVWSTI